MWPLGLSHNRLGSQEGAGWARQQNTKVLPVASAMAGVDMKLQPNAYRELHWHTSAEWALMLKGCCRIAAMNEDGKSFVDDVCEGMSISTWFVLQIKLTNLHRRCMVLPEGRSSQHPGVRPGY